MSEWKPIAEAPKDGSSLLLGNAQGEYRIGFWNGCSWDDGDFFDHMTSHTHFQHLPAPPAAEDA